ncbi:MAG: hypothetical protein HYW45_00390 [Candidatus Daviesbacteria bacterium]|nr:MAG: hypothetical protein HYW45_00390 [Candidatus Daviesbacteria bacterium]
MKNRILVLSFLSILVLLLFLPFILNPQLLLNRNNDLQEVFGPIFLFIKQQVITNHQFPFWNSPWFAGQPLLPDPQFSFFYPPNLLFLILPIGTAFIVTFFFHLLMGGVGIFLISSNIFKLSKFSSLFSATLYISSPKIMGFLVAGHVGLVESSAWIPWVILATIKLSSSANIYWVLLLSASLAGLFFTHTVIFMITISSSIALFLYCLTLQRKNISLSFRFIFLALVGTGGLTAVTLLPQLEWLKSTTRFLLLNTREVFPQWNSVGEFIKSVLASVYNLKNLQNIDSEKWLPLGLLVIILSLIGFLNLKRKFKIILSVTLVSITLISLNNASPLYQFFLKLDPYVLMRVSTRVWFVTIIITTFLASLGIEYIRKKFGFKIAVVIAILAVAELYSISWIYMLKPVEQINFAPIEVTNYFKNDHNLYRVFCVTRCLSQKEAAENKLELIEGYNTIQQYNYYKQSWQLMGNYWNYYTLAIPPFGITEYEQLKPDAKSLGEFNTKYIISPYPLEDQNLKLDQKINDFFIYQNNLFKPRSYFFDAEIGILDGAKINYYSPNLVRVDTSAKLASRVILAQVYSPGWNAYLNGQEKTPVLERPNALMLVDIKPTTKYVDFRYEPGSFKIGLIISLVTLSFYCFLLIKGKVNLKWLQI